MTAIQEAIKELRDKQYRYQDMLSHNNFDNHNAEYLRLTSLYLEVTDIIKMLEDIDEKHKKPVSTTKKRWEGC